ncbi:hypothetical protein B9Z55_014587 [Caenorhabditis nigoni]|nr:hypothetical protein B9Z55_014587 [Caenorhabditis nigoni]
MSQHSWRSLTIVVLDSSPQDWFLFLNRSHENSPISGRFFRLLSPFSSIRFSAITHECDIKDFLLFVVDVPKSTHTELVLHILLVVLQHVSVFFLANLKTFRLALRPKLFPVTHSAIFEGITNVGWKTSLSDRIKMIGDCIL